MQTSGTVIAFGREAHPPHTPHELLPACLQVLPTGKNIHALDPQSIPTVAAIKSAAVVVERLIDREKMNNGGKYPETIALVLWGTDNIKTYGESLAQVGGMPRACPARCMTVLPPHDHQPQ